VDAEFQDFSASGETSQSCFNLISFINGGVHGFLVNIKPTVHSWGKANLVKLLPPLYAGGIIS
jgi:hypothetical protein